MTKWFARSRALWAGLIPLLVVALPMLGVDPVGLEQQLVALGDQLQVTVQQALLLYAGVLGLWHKLRPDGKANTLLPTLPGGA